MSRCIVHQRAMISQSVHSARSQMTLIMRKNSVLNMFMQKAFSFTLSINFEAHGEWSDKNVNTQKLKYPKQRNEMK